MARPKQHVIRPYINSSLELNKRKFPILASLDELFLFLESQNVKRSECKGKKAREKDKQTDIANDAIDSTAQTPTTTTSVVVEVCFFFNEN